jgi:hypothetical protein
MKRILLILLVLLASKTFSQTVTYAFSAGVNFSNLPGNGYPSFSNYLFGVRGGALADIGFRNFSLQPGLLFTKLGGQNTSNTEHLVLNYVQIPLNLIYREKEKDGNFFIGGGPYLSFGTLATYVYGTERDNYYFGNYEGFHRADFGLNVLMGYQFDNGLAISGGYGVGLTDVYSTGPNNRNGAFNISVDYFFKL